MKFILVTLTVLLISLPCHAQNAKSAKAAAAARTARTKLRQSYMDQAVARWPELADSNSRLGQEYAWIYEKLRKTNDPILNDDRCAFLIAFEAAQRIAEEDDLLAQGHARRMEDAVGIEHQDPALGLPLATEWLAGRRADKSRDGSSNQAGVAPSEPPQWGPKQAAIANNVADYALTHPASASTAATAPVNRGSTFLQDLAERDRLEEETRAQRRISPVQIQDGAGLTQYNGQTLPPNWIDPAQANAQFQVQQLQSEVRSGIDAATAQAQQAQFEAQQAQAAVRRAAEDAQYEAMKAHTGW